MACRENKKTTKTTQSAIEKKNVSTDQPKTNAQTAMGSASTHGSFILDTHKFDDKDNYFFFFAPCILC